VYMRHPFDMRSSKILRSSPCGFRASKPAPFCSAVVRNSSTQALLRQNLTSRPSNIIYDYLTPTASHLLNISLADFLPKQCHPRNFTDTDLTLPLARPADLDPTDWPLLPQGHHLVYFSPQVRSSDLLPDGTDLLQSPGPPFVRRMWAGGSLTFNPSPRQQLHLDNTRAACIERIVDVSVKGMEGDEKVFVNVERRYGLADPRHLSELGFDGEEQRPDEQLLLWNYQVEDEEDLGYASVVETRKLVFLREKSAALAKEESARPSKIVKPPHEPDFAAAFTPTKSLLFRFSALTFNAHSIHLDPQYCREVEGHRNLLLHGPLSLVLMLSVLRSQLEDGVIVRKLDYRNLAPLYADEELRVCVRKDRDRPERLDVWIEGKGGGYAVKGSAVVGAIIDLGAVGTEP